MATGASANSNQSLAATDETIFNGAAHGGNCSAIKIRCPVGAAQAVLVNVTPLHKAGEYAKVPVANEETFAGGRADISLVVAKGDGGATTVDWHIVSKR